MTRLTLSTCQKASAAPPAVHTAALTSAPTSIAASITDTSALTQISLTPSCTPIKPTLHEHNTLNTPITYAIVSGTDTILSVPNAYATHIDHIRMLTQRVEKSLLARVEANYAHSHVNTVHDQTVIPLVDFDFSSLALSSSLVIPITPPSILRSPEHIRLPMNMQEQSKIGLLKQIIGKLREFVQTV